MNILFPLGGIGSSSSNNNDNDPYPRPIMNILGRPMLFMVIDHLNLNKNDIIIVAMRDVISEQFQIHEKLKYEYPNLDIRFVKLCYQTFGAAETILTMMNILNDNEKNRKTITMGYEVVYFSDILLPLRRMPKNMNATLFFIDDEFHKPVYSYLKFKKQWKPPQELENKIKLPNSSGSDTNDDYNETFPKSKYWPIVNDIREKVMISSFANLGTYVFSNGHILKKYILLLMSKENCTKDDLYISTIQRTMINDGLIISGLYVERFAQLDSPKRMLRFFELVEKYGFQLKRPMRLCFTLDGTLLTHPSIIGDYSTCKPVQKTIQLLRILHRIGHTILIQTSRNNSNIYNIGAGMKNIGPLTFHQLEEYGIPYDEIYFGQPNADIFIDGSSINSQIDAARQLGWMELEDNATLVKESSMIKCRDFNIIQIRDDTVKKSGPFDIMAGELYFYEHMPIDICDLFPKFIECAETADGGRSITLQRIRGVPYGLLIMNHTITYSRLLRVFESLKRIHNSKDAKKYALPYKNINIYCNYSQKLKKRYKKYYKLYQKYNRSQEIYDKLIYALDDYEKNDRAIYSDCIHGDPVLTNIIGDLEKVYFLDMRGMLGDICTMQGDIVYDLSKLYQSLNGYEILLADENLDLYENTLKELRTYFWTYIEENYSNINSNDIKLVTTSLLFSLIPLHSDNNTYLNNMWQLCCRLYDELPQY